jgi:DNA-binding MarR family transcriptional regulator
MADENTLLKKILIEIKKTNQKLDRMASLTKLTKASELQVALTRLQSSKIKTKIFELCNGKHTVSNIVEKLQKPQPMISKYLNEMERSGLIISEKSGKEKRFFKAI